MAKILLVDDSSTQISAMTRMLESSGHSVITASDGNQAVAMASSEKPDIILMDVVMPGLNGFQATRQITRSPDTEHIPVIMLTSKDQETDKVWAQRQGASDYVTKPPGEKELMQKIQHLLDNH